jgi:transposase
MSLFSWVRNNGNYLFFRPSPQPAGYAQVRKQKTDREDAQLILRLLLEDRFPQIWVPSWENRDLRQLLWHRHRMVQARTRIMNQLHGSL